MLTLTDILILHMVPHLMHAHLFHCQMVNLIKLNIFGVDNCSSANIDIKKCILIFGKGSTYGLDDTTITAEAEYHINISKSKQKISSLFALQWTQQFCVG